MTLRCGWRRSFRSAKTGEVSKSHWNGPPVDVPQTPDVFARVPTTPRTMSSIRQHEIEPDDHDSNELGWKLQRTKVGAHFIRVWDNGAHGEICRWEFPPWMSTAVIWAWMIIWIWKHGLRRRKMNLPLETCPLNFGLSYPADCHPPEPEPWVDRVADAVELSQLCNMNVIVKETQAKWTLATPHNQVCRWLASQGQDQSWWQQWETMVAAFKIGGKRVCFREKTRYVFSCYKHPYSECIAMKFLQSLVDVPTFGSECSSKVCLGTLDL